MQNLTVIQIYSITLKGHSPKNENSVINYSPSCRSKPVRPLFIFARQIRHTTYTIQPQKGSEDIVKIVHVTVVQP